jgi:hypothetical protein
MIQSAQFVAPLGDTIARGTPLEASARAVGVAREASAAYVSRHRSSTSATLDANSAAREQAGNRCRELLRR